MRSGTNCMVKHAYLTGAPGIGDADMENVVFVFFVLESKYEFIHTP